MENLEVQDAEMECLSSTFDASDPMVSLEYNKNSRRGSFTISQSLGSRRINLLAMNTTPNTRNDFFVSDGKIEYYEISHLPPLRFHFALPAEYPDTVGPEFFLESIWLPGCLLNRLNDRLKELISENAGEPVLWLLIDTIRNEGVEICLGSHYDFTKNAKLDLITFYGNFDEAMPLPLSACHELLVSHNDDCLDLEFQKSLSECAICAETKKGSRFFRFPKCRHRFCRDCVQNAFVLAIKDGFMSSRLTCLECDQEAGYHEVRSVVSRDWFEQYEALALKRGISLMRDVVVCPRPGCETVVLLDDNTLGRCPQCELAFCPHCLKTYHGTVQCAAFPRPADALSPEDLKRIKKEENATDRFLEEETTRCPGCWAPCLVRDQGY
ncbi:unnamed protein product [Echinostoma caproni]|uniref:RBR-type E3 ubiquitin transferase n=1 Tax=Echinostoma caproni TaxID=27848 RepID=A0A183B399_9TREM|nr:unnamed protein product [Echinostoma caproni]